MRQFLFRSAWAICAGLGATVAAAIVHAHPHEFIDAGLTFRFDDQGRLGAIGVVWVYDELTSMLIVEDLGLDPNGAGVLSEAEKTRVAEIFGTWEDFDGDLYLTRGGAGIALSGPLDTVVDYRDGRLVLSYLRALPERVDMAGGAVLAQVYDPSYYVFYDLLSAPAVAGRDDCAIEIRTPDRSAAQRLYEAALAQLTDEEILEEGRYPEVGGAFADEVRLECPARP